MRGRGLYFLGGGQFILRPFSHFKKQVLKNSSISACGALVFNLHILSFKQILTLTLNLNFFAQGAVSFHPSVGSQIQPNP